MTVWVAIESPHCHRTEVTKYGKSPVGKQRYRCQNADCPYRTFVLTQTYPGRTREVKQQIVEMTTPVACDGKPVFSAGSSMVVESEI